MDIQLDIVASSRKRLALIQPYETKSRICSRNEDGLQVSMSQILWLGDVGR